MSKWSGLRWPVPPVRAHPIRHANRRGEDGVGPNLRLFREGVPTPTGPLEREKAGKMVE